MNIRKKVLFNPSNITSTKADSSDNTTANTKNSAILDQSKTFRITGCGQQFVIQRSKNYLRSLSRQLRKQNSAHVQNIAIPNPTKPTLIPSYSTISNNTQHLPPLKKQTLHNRNFVLVQSNQLSHLASLKRPIVLSSQNDRKPPAIFPSTYHVNSNRDIGVGNMISKKQFHCQRKVHIGKILDDNNNNDEQLIQRRKQQLNSMNVMVSLGASRHSIALSKFSLGSKQSYRNQHNSSKNTDVLLSGDRQQLIKPSKFIQQNQQYHQKSQSRQVQLDGDVNNISDQIEESIVEEIERNKSIDKVKYDVEEGNNIQNQWNNNEDNQQQHSIYQSKTVQARIVNNNQSLQSQQSLCESQQIDQSQLQQKKNAYRTPRNQQSQRKQYSFNKDQDFCLDTMKSQQQQSSLCQSYHMQTPVKGKQSVKRYLRFE